MHTIKEMREMLGMTQKEFADNFDIPVGTIRRWEYGESRPAPYVLKLISEKLPVKQDSLERIETKEGTFFYDKESNIIEDLKGTKIKVHEDMDGVKRLNLGIYAKDLFEAYYDAVEKFDKDCRLDKEEDIIWG